MYFVNGFVRPAMVSGLEGTILKYKRLDTDESRGLDVAEVGRYRIIDRQMDIYIKIVFRYIQEIVPLFISKP